MCRLYAGQDPATFAAETRSVRLNGQVTSLRLEAAFWDILQEIAAREGMSLGRFLSQLHEEILQLRGDVPNFASTLRVICLQDLRRRAKVNALPAPLTAR